MVEDELKIQTEIGQLTMVYVSFPLNCYQDVYTAWLKEVPRIVVSADSINEAIDELHLSLAVMIKIDNKMMMEIANKINKNQQHGIN